MRLAVIADVHSNLEALTVVLEEIRMLGADRIFHLGDIVGYNANPNECIDALRADNVDSISGNHDDACAGRADISGFKEDAAAAIVYTARELRPDNLSYLSGLQEYLRQDGKVPDMLFVHGAPSKSSRYIYCRDGALREIPAMDPDIEVCFFGHTHVPAFYSSTGGLDGRNLQGQPCKVKLDGSGPFFVNPGSVGQPRDGNPRAAYCVYDTSDRVVYFYRSDYNIDLAKKAIVAAGLPSFNAERLSKGK